MCVCEEDRLALYQVLKRSPWLSRSTLEHNKGKRCFNTHPGGNVGGLRGKTWAQAGHRTLTHAVVSLSADHWVAFAVASASPALCPVNLPSSHPCMTASRTCRCLSLLGTDLVSKLSSPGNSIQRLSQHSSHAAPELFCIRLIPKCGDLQPPPTPCRLYCI